MNQYKTLRIVALLEGLSFLILLFICMPLKYIWGMPEAVSIIGMAHGLLFMGYILLVFMYGAEVSWGGKNTALALLGGILPFGTFVADSKIFKKFPS